MKKLRLKRLHSEIFETPVDVEDVQVESIEVALDETMNFPLEKDDILNMFMVMEDEIEFLAAMNTQLQEAIEHMNQGRSSFPLEVLLGLVKKLMIGIRELHQEATKFQMPSASLESLEYEVYLIVAVLHRMVEKSLEKLHY